MPEKSSYNLKTKRKSLMRKVKMAVTGKLHAAEHSPAGRKYLKRKKKTSHPSTKGIESRLRQAGLTEAEINKLR